MNLIVIMAASFCIGQIIPEQLRPLLWKLKKKIGLRRLKPFDCEACLSFWFTLFLSLTETTVLLSILSAIVVFCITVKYEMKKISE
jgi:hypothetical protein